MSKAGKGDQKTTKIKTKPSNEGIQKPSVLQDRTKSLQKRLKDLQNGPLNNASPATSSQWLKMIEKFQKQADTFDPQLESFVNYDTKAQGDEVKKSNKEKEKKIV
jgi:hypothetical protein